MKHMKSFLFLLTFLFHAILLPMCPAVKGAVRLTPSLRNALLNKISQPRRYAWSFMDSHWKQAQDILPLTRIEQGRKTLDLMQGEYESFALSANALEQRKKQLLDYHASAIAALWHLDHNDDKTQKKAVKNQIKLVEKLEEDLSRGIRITRKQIDCYEVWETINGVPMIYQEGDYIC